LNELMQGAPGATGLGIYRTAVEGGFTIRTEVRDSVVTVIAERELTTGG
jgi:hypothetical protein